MFDHLAVRQAIAEEGVDGWLLYSFGFSNSHAINLLGLLDAHLTRRFFYWVPKEGDPILLCHFIDKEQFPPLPGKVASYKTWREMEMLIAAILEGSRRIAMEFSPFNTLPSVASVDAGTVDFIRRLGSDVVSSADLLQRFTALLDDAALTSHRAAAAIAEETAAWVWKWIGEVLSGGGKISEYDVQQKIIQLYEKAGCIADAPPICAVNANSAIPHYNPKKESSASVKPGDFILIDLWCKQKQVNAVYGDITQVGVAASHPNPRQQEIFSVVRGASDRATAYVIEAYNSGKILKGWEVDRACRNVIEAAGYGDFFVHRTGHSLGSSVHGSGCNIDDFETRDDRSLLPGSCFTIEPGIYLPGEFGVRLEYDLFLGFGGEVIISGGIQTEIFTLFPA